MGGCELYPVLFGIVGIFLTFAKPLSRRPRTQECMKELHSNVSLNKQQVYVVARDLLLYFNAS